MKKLIAALLVVGCAGVLHAHDLFLKLGSYFVTPGATVTLDVLNGNFTTSENSVDRNRVRDISVVGPGGRTNLDTMRWTPSGKKTTLSFEASEAGTYVVAASTLPRGIELAAKDFNEYLAHDGIPDIIALRRKNGETGKAAKEQYSKHVKALVQAGSPRTANVSEVLGYPAEIVPLGNPYSMKAGGILRIRAMVDGKAVANQPVVSGGRSTRGARFRERMVRTDADGVARIQLPARGQWYVKFINMVPVNGNPEFDYESKWATLTFQIR